MSLSDIEKMKKLIEDKRAKGGFLQAEKRIGSTYLSKKKN